MKESDLDAANKQLEQQIINATTQFKHAFNTFKNGYNEVVELSKSINSFIDQIKQEDISTIDSTTIADIKIFVPTGGSYENDEKDLDGRYHPYLVPTSLLGTYTFTRSKTEFLKYCNSVLYTKGLDDASISEQLSCLLEHTIPVECLTQALNISNSDMDNIISGNVYPYLQSAWKRYFNTLAEYHPVVIEKKSQEAKELKRIFSKDNDSPANPSSIKEESLTLDKLKELFKDAPYDIKRIKEIINSSKYKKFEFIKLCQGFRQLLYTNKIGNTAISALNDNLGFNLIFVDKTWVRKINKPAIKDSKQSLFEASVEPVEGTVGNLIDWISRANESMHNFSIITGMCVSAYTAKRRNSKLRSSTMDFINRIIGKEVFKISDIKIKKVKQHIGDIQNLKQLLSNKTFNSPKEFAIFIKMNKINQSEFARLTKSSRQYVTFLMSGIKPMTQYKKELSDQFGCVFNF